MSAVSGGILHPPSPNLSSRCGQTLNWQCGWARLTQLGQICQHAAFHGRLKKDRSFEGCFCFPFLPFCTQLLAIQLLGAAVLSFGGPPGAFQVGHARPHGTEKRLYCHYHRISAKMLDCSLPMRVWLVLCASGTCRKGFTDIKFDREIDRDL